MGETERTVPGRSLSSTGPVRWAVEPLDDSLDPGTVLTELPVVDVVRARGARLSRHRDRVAFAQARRLALALAHDDLQHGRGPSWAGTLALVQSCPDCGGGDHGAPALVAPSPGADARRRIPLHVSWAHSTGHVAAAVSVLPCGVDVETAGGPTPEFVLTAEEIARWDARGRPAALFRWWFTVKETAVKCGLLDIDAFGEVSAEELVRYPGVVLYSSEVPGTGPGNGASASVMVRNA